MNKSFYFDFEEMPVTVDGGFDLGSMVGRADISYNSKGEWGIDGIQLLGAKKITYAPGERLKLAALGEAAPNYEHKMIWLDRGTPLFLMLHDVLETKWFATVQEAVNEQIENNRADALDFLADQRRDDRMMEGTR